MCTCQLKQTYSYSNNTRMVKIAFGKCSWRSCVSVGVYKCITVCFTPIRILFSNSLWHVSMLLLYRPVSNFSIYVYGTLFNAQLRHSLPHQMYAPWTPSQCATYISVIVSLLQFIWYISVNKYLMWWRLLLTNL